MSRKLMPALSVFIQNRIACTLDQLKTLTKTKVFIYGVTAMSGVTEATGNNDGTQVNEIQATEGDSTGASWCMDTVQSIIRFVELVFGVTSGVFSADNCVEVFNKSLPENKISAADWAKTQPGDIIIFEHGSTSEGHTEVLLSTPDELGLAISIGGNTTPGAGYSGHDGVFTKIRPMTSPIGDMHIIGFLRPFP